VQASGHCGAKSQRQRSRALALNPIKPSCGVDGLRTFFLYSVGFNSRELFDMKNL
jgi:hypothetical protein